jgi:hypothetical protein
MQIRGRLPVTVASLVLFVGCASHPRIPSWSFEPTASPRFLIAEPARDRNILVYITGNARHHGPLWVPADASLATIEELATLSPDLASRHVEITRVEADGKWTLSVRLNRMRRREKEEIGIRHGDVISFFWDRCWGAINDFRSPQVQGLCISVFNSKVVEPVNSRPTFQARAAFIHPR